MENHYLVNLTLKLCSTQLRTAIDHLGLVAGIIDEIGIVEIINERVGIYPGEIVTAGQVVKAILLQRFVDKFKLGDIKFLIVLNKTEMQLMAKQNA